MNSGNFSMLEAEKKHLMQENAPEKNSWWMKALKKIIGNTKFTQKPSPSPPPHQKWNSWPVNTVTVHLPVFFVVVVFLFSDNSYWGTVSKKENYVDLEAPSHVDIFFMKKYHDTSFCILVYNFPQRRSNIYVALFTDPIVVLLFTRSVG